MADHSFDIASKIDFQEVSNAINQALREITNRYDLKDSNSKIEFEEKESLFKLESSEEYKLNAVKDIFKQNLVKRGISLKALNENKPESSLSGRFKQNINCQQGISSEKVAYQY